MINREKVDAKVTPEMAIFVQLDELNGRIGQLTEMIDSTRAHGLRHTRIISVTDVPQIVVFDAIAYTLYNDGPNTVYTSDQGPQVMTGVEAGLASGESDYVDLRRRQPTQFWVACASAGTASLRLRILI